MSLLRPFTRCSIVLYKHIFIKVTLKTVAFLFCDTPKNEINLQLVLFKFHQNYFFRKQQFLSFIIYKYTGSK